MDAPLVNQINYEGNLFFQKRFPCINPEAWLTDVLGRIAVCVR
jgi:hypothetical protein